MFWGEFSTTIDGKGRTSIPAKYREIFVESFGDERFFITKCLVSIEGQKGRGLTIYPRSEFVAFADGLSRQGYSAAQINAIQRLVIAPAVECTADKQGRVLIPPTLRAYAGLERDLVVVGMEKKIELWDQQTWSQVVSQAEDVFLAATEVPALPGI
jgi:MraZ protein